MGVRAVGKVIDVYWLSLDTPGVIWVLEVRNLDPVTVAINSSDEVWRLIEERNKKILELQLNKS